jgi:hypothetical protein
MVIAVLDGMILCGSLRTLETQFHPLYLERTEIEDRYFHLSPQTEDIFSTVPFGKLPITITSSYLPGNGERFGRRASLFLLPMM